MLEEDNRYLVKIGDRVRQLRLAAGISQEELALRAEIGFKQVGRIERGEVNATLLTIRSLAVGLGVDEAALFEK